MKTIKISRCAIIDKDKLLVIFRNKFQEYVMPGGKIDPGEDKKEAAIRETKEEIGCDVELIKELQPEEFNINDKHYLEYKFIARIKGDQKPKIKEDRLLTHQTFITLRNYICLNLLSSIYSDTHKYQ